MSNDTPFVRASGAGENLWMMGALMTIKVAGEDSGDRFALVEHLAPKGLATPLHSQPLEDETFYVLEGEIELHIDGREQTAGPGAVVHVPRDAPHAFRVVSEQARLLSMHDPAGHERFFRAAGDPAPSATLPPPADGPPDIERVLAAAAAHDVEILGPPPWS